MAKRKAEDEAAGVAKKVAMPTVSRNVRMITEQILQPMAPTFQRWQADGLDALAAGGLNGMDAAAFREAMKKDGCYTCVVPFYHIGLVSWH